MYYCVSYLEEYGTQNYLRVYQSLMLGVWLDTTKFVDVALLLVDNDFRLTAYSAVNKRLCYRIAGMVRLKAYIAYLTNCHYLKFMKSDDYKSSSYRKARYLPLHYPTPTE